MIGTPETPLSDLFAMPVKSLVIGEFHTSTPTHVFVALTLEDGRRSRIIGETGESWRDVLQRAMDTLTIPTEDVA